jgi:hypothetical protein
MARTKRSAVSIRPVRTPEDATRARRAFLAGAILATVIVALASCGGSGGEKAADYRPDIIPANFTSVVDNPYFPLLPGTTFHYRTPDGAERVDVTVTSETRVVMGVACTVAESREYEGDRLAEVTHDWYAQDDDGSVWYFGEETVAYSEDGSESRSGSWEAGVDGALPGIIMPGESVVGEPFRQEYYAGRAEDMGQVERLDAAVQVPYGTFDNALVTRDWTPLEPDAVEHKYYVSGVGLVLEDEGAARVELVDVTLSEDAGR